MPMKNIKIALAFLLSISLLPIAISDAAAIEPLSNPQISYSDGTGLNILATPAKWSATTKSTYQWFLAGKAVTGAKKLSFKATSKEKNLTIQFRETSADGKVASSVVGKIGQVIVNSNPTISFSDSTNSLIKVLPGAVSPKTTKVSYLWYKGPIDIAGAKSDTYKPATGDQGFSVYVNAKYTAKGFTEKSVNSTELAVPVIKRVYSQLWQDEFNGAAGSLPDSNVWVSEDGDGSKAAAGPGWGNKERQYYLPHVAKINSDGALTIVATTKDAGANNCYYKTPCEWVSAKYITKGKVGFKYGRIEARIKGPVGAGTWGAFWMLGADIDSRRWPWCGEIDVTELLGKSPTTAYGYLHGLISDAAGRGATLEMPNGFASEYHTYSIDWLPDQIDWYVDGQLLGSQQKLDKDWVFDHEFYLIVNLAMGGNFGGAIDASLTEANMSFDWIRFSSINGVGEVIKH